jgi:type IV pilus assembly protein PilN
MIKINLLTPERPKKSKKKLKFQAQLIWAGLAVATMVLAWFFSWSLLDDKVTQLQANHSELTTELASLKMQVKEVDSYEANKTKVNKKIEIIQKLRKNQSVPVHLLDEISKRLPARVWLLSLSEQDGNVDLSGKATSNSEIVDFTNNLKTALAFENVQILETRQKEEANITVYSFRLKWMIKA